MDVADSPAGNASLLLIAGILLFMQAGLFWCDLSSALHAKTEFRAFHTAAHLVEQGRAQEMFSYEAQRQAQSALFAASGQTLPFLCPGYAALLFVPFALLPFGVAYLLFTLLNLTTLWIAVHQLCERAPTLRRWPPGLRCGLVAALLSLTEVLIQGQISILLLLYMWMDALLAQREELLAGVVLAVCLVKFQIAIPVALLFLAWRCYLFWLAFCAVPRAWRWSRWLCAAKAVSWVIGELPSLSLVQLCSIPLLPRLAMGCTRTICRTCMASSLSPRMAG